MIGTTLRAAREARHLSIRDINVSTNMMVKQIEQIEANDFDSFSAPVYAKGFIKLYARAVGIDAKPLIDEYNRMLRDGDAKPRPPVDLPFLKASDEGDVSAKPGEAVAQPVATDGDGQAVPEAERAAETAEGVDPEKSREPDLFDQIATKPAASEVESAAAAPVPAVEPKPMTIAEKGDSAANPVSLEAGVLPEVRKPVSQPVKRVAPVEPGYRPPEFEVPATRLTERPVFTPPPVAKKEGPEPESPIFHAAPHSSHAVTPGELPKPIATKTAPLDLGTPASCYKPASAPAAAESVANGQPSGGSLFAMEGKRESVSGRESGSPQPSAQAVPAEEASSSKKSKEPHFPVKRPAPDPAATVPVTDPNAPGLFRFLFVTARDAFLHFCDTCKKKVFACAERRIAEKTKAAHLRNHPDFPVDTEVQAPRLRLSKRGKIVLGLAFGAVALLVFFSPLCFLSWEQTPEENEEPAGAEAALSGEASGTVAEIPAPTTIAPIIKAPYSFAN
ncbi:MAG: helix-turn-helix domain-containing protein [Kiritimatiellia bacterium]